MMNYLDENRQKFGVDRFSFAPNPFDDKETQGGHTSISLWADGDVPLFADPHTGSEQPLLALIANVMAEVQPALTLFFAQSDEAYARLNSRIWAPSTAGVSREGNDGLSIRVTHETDARSIVSAADRASATRIENRLPASNSNYLLVMAATLASVEYALNQHTRLYQGNKLPEEGIPFKGYKMVNIGDNTLVMDDDVIGRVSRYKLPRSRYEAVEGLKKLPPELVRILGKPLISAIINQHTKPADVSADVAAPELASRDNRLAM
jgi:glutamine synthetase